MVARAAAPSRSGATGTSRQPRTVRPSSAAIVSMRETASARRSSVGGQEGDADGVGAGLGQLEAGDLAEEGVRDLEQDAGAVARVGLGAGGAAVLEVAQYGERLLDQRMAGLAGEGGHEADAAGVVLVAGVVHTLRGRASIHERPFGDLECWDGWRGVRIGSPVVVVAYALPRDDVGPLRAKFRAGYMMERFSGSG